MKQLCSMHTKCDCNRRQVNAIEIYYVIASLTETHGMQLYLTILTCISISPFGMHSPNANV